MLGRALSDQIVEWRIAPWLAPLVGFALALVASWLLSEAVARLGRHFGLLDQPGGRHRHAAAAPRLGGVAIFLAFALAAAFLYHPSGPYEAHVVNGLFAAALLTVSVMLVDDLRGLPVSVRIVAQTAAAALVMYPAASGMVIEVIHNPLGSGAGAIIPLPLWLAVPFTWFWIVGMMNTINWVDGMDGLAGGVVAIAAAVMALVSWMLGQATVAALCAMLAGACAGFLLLNWRPGALFMGDNGAMFLGLALATLAGIGGAKLAMMLLLLGVPILDALLVIVTRLTHGRSPASADLRHLHYRLIASGFSRRQVALLFYAVTAAFGVITIVAAYLQAHAWRWNAVLHITPWLRLAVTEAPTALGLLMIPTLTLVIWLLLRRRRAEAPGHSPGGRGRNGADTGGRELSLSASGSHRRP
jgi:UDP-GlcNAc:undecaprenyl-phosphate GlcNAc-1-phosphate transferase